ncbi:uncharacterized protein LODBEIA_P13350 [Lodderomyces beijingensis]|uniref:Zn(2)-C6 fungal-type domain-containing protein n=1 Tax=Lodderomyces beijingensis TaxID=1775926 RepID=A0ABP0ZJS5_9ASCO
MSAVTGVLDLGLRQSAGKRIYSKNGCRECKRRKIKCSEDLPACAQCARLKKECSYPEPGERVLRVSRKKQKLQNNGVDNDTPHDDSIKVIKSEPIPEQPQSQNFYSVIPPHGAEPRPSTDPNFNRMAPLANAQQLPYPLQVQERGHSPSFAPAPPAPAPAPPAPPAPPPPPPPPPPGAAHLPGIQEPFNYGAPRPPYFNQPHPPMGEIYRREDPYAIRLPLPQLSSSRDTLLGTGLHKKLNYDLPISKLARPAAGSRLTSLLNSRGESPTDTNGNGAILPTPSLNPPQDDLGGYLDQTDLSVLANDLNNMVNGILYEKNNETTMSKEINPSIKTIHAADRLNRNIPVDFIKLENEVDQVYLEEFYHRFAKIVLPFSSFDTRTKSYFNPARDILLCSAADSKYVLAALLAFGARSKFNTSSKREDEDYYYLYLLDCVKLLGPAIADDKTLGSKIESVLLTVLLLAAANAANPKQDWRPHLKGAKDLLRKISKKTSHSKIFIFCKSWFVTLEVLAGISSNRGGTLTTEDEVDELINSGSAHEKRVLTDLGIILENGFNILAGYHNDCYDYFGQLIKILNRKRANILNTRNSTEYIKLLADLQRQTEIQFTGNAAIPGNPTVLVDQINNDATISWMDVSHQSYIQAAMIIVLSSCFEEPYDSPQVQVLTDCILRQISFIRDYKPTASSKAETGLMMIQWSALVAGTHLVAEKDKQTIRDFFEMSSRVGSGGALIALKRVERLWARRSDPNLSDDGNESEDLVSY